MRRSVSIIMSILSALTFITAFAGCNMAQGNTVQGTPVTVKAENEENAKAVYSCPSDNMFGLERVVTFERSVVLVFDKNISDKNRRYGGSLEGITDKDFNVYISLNNAGAIEHKSGSIEVRDGKYVVTKNFREYEIHDPDKDVTIESVRVGSKSVFINEGRLHLIYMRRPDDKTVEFYEQVYDPSTGTWCDVRYSKTADLGDTIDAA